MVPDNERPNADRVRDVISGTLSISFYEDPTVNVSVHVFRAFRYCDEIAAGICGLGTRQSHQKRICDRIGFSSQLAPLALHTFALLPIIPIASLSHTIPPGAVLILC